MTDLQGKYQKLASEYSKLRAQLPVLKKAVLDEQAKEEDLKEEIKEKDQTIRKFEQEIDSLSFRNQQLSSRVLVLQQDLEISEVRGKKHKGLHLFHKTGNSTKNSPPPSFSVQEPGANVIGEELTGKIEENARLHKQVYEANIEHEQVTMTLRDRLTTLESDAAKHSQVLALMTAQNKEKVDKLQEEKVMLEVRLQKVQNESKEASVRAELAEEKLKTLESDLSGRLSEATRIIREKVPFNDTRKHDLNALNLPTHDRRHQLQAMDLVGQAATLIKELLQSLSNYYTYSEQRSRVYPVDADREPLSDINKRLCQHLRENANYLRPVEHAFRSFLEGLGDDSLTTLETAVGLQDFAAKFNKYVVYATKLLPYQLLSLEEESSVSSCPRTLAAKNMELHASFKGLTSTLSRVDTYIALIALQSTANCDHPKSNYSKLFLLLSQGVATFHEAAKEVSKHYNSKVTLEHQLPTATQKLKTTDECIVSSLISLVTCTSKFASFLTGNQAFFSEPAGYSTRGSRRVTSEGMETPRSNPVVTIFRQRAAKYMASLSRPCPETVPYKVAVENRKTLLSSTESRESLSQQVITFHERLSHLEQEKEHWMLEAQLLQMKYDKERMKTTDLGRLVKNSPGGVTVPTCTPSVNSQPLTNDSSAAVDTSVLGMLETSPVAETDGQMREQLIKNHFSGRVLGLTSEKQTADSKALHFHAECRALHQRLAISDRQKQSLQQEVAAAMQTITQLKDELQTTTRSYEGQLSMMSEHLAGMNEKLTTQKDEIDMLKYQIHNPKANKKSKGK